MKLLYFKKIQMLLIFLDTKSFNSIGLILYSFVIMTDLRNRIFQFYPVRPLTHQ